MREKLPFFLTFLLAFFLVLFSYPEEITIRQLVEEISSIPSPTGYEEALVEKLEKYLPSEYSLEKDNLGSLYLTLGKGKPHLALLASMDEVGYFVSGFRPNGYLFMDRAVPAPNLLFDSFHQGQPLIILTSTGPVYGILALPSVHFIPREKRGEFQNYFTLDNAFLDIGVRSESKEAKRKVEILDAVVAWREFAHLARERIAGPSLGKKACCALLLALAREIKQKKLNQKITFVWIAQNNFVSRHFKPRATMGVLRAEKKLRPDNVIIIDTIPCKIGDKKNFPLGNGPVIIQSKDEKSALREEIELIAKEKDIPLGITIAEDSVIMNPFSAKGKDVLTLALPLKFPSTPVEVVDFKDVEFLKSILHFFLEQRRKQ